MSLYPLNRLGGHHSLCGRFGEEKNNLTLPGFEHSIIPLVAESRYRLLWFSTACDVSRECFVTVVSDVRLVQRAQICGRPRDRWPQQIHYWTHIHFMQWIPEVICQDRSDLCLKYIHTVPLVRMLCTLPSFLYAFLVARCGGIENGLFTVSIEIGIKSVK